LKRRVKESKGQHVHSILRLLTNELSNMHVSRHTVGNQNWKNRSPALTNLIDERDEQGTMLYIYMLATASSLLYVHVKLYMYGSISRSNGNNRLKSSAGKQHHVGYLYH